MQAPIAKFARTLNEVPSRFVRTLAAVETAAGGRRQLKPASLPEQKLIQEKTKCP